MCVCVVWDFMSLSMAHVHLSVWTLKYTPASNITPRSGQNKQYLIILNNTNALCYIPSQWMTCLLSVRTMRPEDKEADWKYLLADQSATPSAFVTLSPLSLYVFTSIVCIPKAFCICCVVNAVSCLHLKAHTEKIRRETAPHISMVCSFLISYCGIWVFGEIWKWQSWANWFGLNWIPIFESDSCVVLRTTEGLHGCYTSGMYMKKGVKSVNCFKVLSPGLTGCFYAAQKSNVSCYILSSVPLPLPIEQTHTKDISLHRKPPQHETIWNQIIHSTCKQNRAPCHRHGKHLVEHRWAFFSRKACICPGLPLWPDPKPLCKPLQNVQIHIQNTEIKPEQTKYISMETTVRLTQKPCHMHQ